MRRQEAGGSQVANLGYTARSHLKKKVRKRATSVAQREK
jgi:hypothetical protein